jgi:hypothetical protein
VKSLAATMQRLFVPVVETGYTWGNQEVPASCAQELCID